MAEIWGVVAAAAVGVVGSAVVANNNKPPTPAARNLGGELGSLGALYPDILATYLGSSPSVTQNTLGNISSLAGRNFDSGRFFADQPDWEDAYNRDRSMNYAEHPERAGWTPEQYAQYAFHGDQSKIDPYTSMGGGIPGLASNLNTASRTANLQDVQNLGSQYLDITRGANQDYYNALNSYTTATQQPIAPSAAQTQAAQRAGQGFGTFDSSGLMATTPNGSPLLDQLNQRAMNAGPSGLQTQQNDLAAQLLSQGGNLSASDLRNVQQASRAGFAARGLDATNASVVDETMQTDAARRARLLQNLGIAQSVQNQGLAEQNQQNQFGLGVSNQNFGYGQLGLQGQMANQNFGLNAFNSNLASQQSQQQSLNQSAALAEQQRQAQLAAQAQAVQLQRQGYLDPFAAVIGSADQNLLGQTLGVNQGNMAAQSGLYGSLLGYGQDLNNTNYNANAAANIAGYNGNQALYGSLISAGSNLGSAYLANK